MTGKKTYFLSDLHMGVNYKTNWFQTSLHKSYLKSVLKHIQNDGENVNDVVILGDWFDLWTYPPNKQPPTTADILASHPEVFTKQGDTGDFITLAESISGDLNYVSGNHDMLVTPNAINAYFSRHTGKGIKYPTVEFRNKTLSGYSDENHRIIAVHGHQFDLFNRCDEREDKLYMGLPIGHFITRVVGLLCEEMLIKEDQPNAAMIKDSGNPTFSFKLGWLGAENMMSLIAGKKDLAKSLIYTLIEDSEHKPSSINYAMYNNSTISNKSMLSQFKHLWSLSQENMKALFDTGMESSLTWIAEEMMKKHPIVIMGHTHQPVITHHTLGYSHEGVYANCGYHCPDLPDMKKNEKFLSFVEVEEKTTGTTITLNRVDYNTLGIVPLKSHTIEG